MITFMSKHTPTRPGKMELKSIELKTWTLHNSFYFIFAKKGFIQFLTPYVHVNNIFLIIFKRKIKGLKMDY